MNELEYFLELNRINKEDLFEALHLDIREVLLRIICEKLKKDKSFFLWAKRIYFSCSDDIEATKKIIDKACNCALSVDDLKWMNNCIKAHFSKKSSRDSISNEIKENLLAKQKGKCAICGCGISMSNIHVDHIIPWDYVGDQLENNYQGLCADCNLSKSNHVAITVTNLILHREVNR